MTTLSLATDASAFDRLQAELSLDRDAREALAALHLALPRHKRDQGKTTQHLARLLLGQLGKGTAWESQRIRAAREALTRVAGAHVYGTPALLHPEQRLCLA